MSEKIPEGWKRVKLGEIAEIIMGQSPESKFYNNKGDGLPFLQGSKTFGYKFPKIEMYCQKPIRIAKKGDILFSVRAPVGDINLANQDICIGRGLSIIRYNNGDNLYLYYLLRFYRDEILNLQSGTVFEAISKKELENFDVLISEDINEQKAIASVLSALDDKIDLLHRQNQTLEKMAETLFKKWFIEDAKDDWEEVSLGDSDLATIISSGIEKFEGEKIYLETGNVQDTNIMGGIKITYENRPSRANMQPVKFSVWFAKKGGVRKLLMFDDYSDTNKYILSTGFSGLKTNELSHYYIWCFVLTKEFQEIKDSFVSGSVQPDITNEGIKQITILKPDNQTLKKFNEIVKPLFYKYQQNKEQIQTLENLRDTLLPKLMSGEIRVKMGDNNAK